MRIGLQLPDGSERGLARAAEDYGMFGVLAGADNALTAISAACYASVATERVRIVVRVGLGLEHPITIAEELSVLDNISNGRVVVVIDTREMDAEAAQEELSIIQLALACRPFNHHGAHFDLPTFLPGNEEASSTIMVTPKPVQVQVPFWAMGRVAPQIVSESGISLVAESPANCSAALLVQPGVQSITGALEEDRRAVIEWAAAGATHLLVRIPEQQEVTVALRYVARYLIPEVAMPDYPRIMSEAKVPPPWPGPEQ